MTQLLLKKERSEEHLVCKLKKSINDLKQSPKCWNTALDCHLKQMGFVQSASDPCIYHMDEGADMSYLGVLGGQHHSSPK